MISFGERRAGGRSKALDGLRGVAVLLVVASHISGRRAANLGPTGVTIFFVLSGYLITGTLLKEHALTGQVNLRAFYMRRLLRLAPALLLMVAVLPPLLLIVHDPRLETAAPGVVTSAFYLQDYASASGHQSILTHTWSLAVEEQFYLLWPAVLLTVLASRTTRNRLFPAVLTLIAVAYAWRVASIFLLPGEWTYFAFDTNAALLLTGCGLAVHRNKGNRSRPPGWLAAGLLALFCFVPIVTSAIQRDPWITGNLLTIAVAAGTVIAISGAESVPLLTNPCITWFGRISYGLYLWHFVLLTLEPNGHSLHGMQRPLAVGVAIGVAALSWYFFESPILRLKRRYEVGSTDPEPGQPGFRLRRRRKMWAPPTCPFRGGSDLRG